MLNVNSRFLHSWIISKATAELTWLIVYCGMKQSHYNVEYHHLQKVLPRHRPGSLESGADLTRDGDSRAEVKYSRLYLNIGMVSSGCSWASWRDRYSWDLEEGGRRGRGRAEGVAGYRRVVAAVRQLGVLFDGEAKCP